jgi:hydroxypyruvate isomerase
MLFAPETGEFAERIRLAKAAGLDTVEFWRWSNKDLPAIESVLDETGVTVAAIVAEPMIAITDPANREAFLVGLNDTITVARRLGAKVLIAQSGDADPDKSRAEQADALAGTLTAAANLLRGTGIRIGLEPLNDRVDHPGYYLTSTRQGFDILDRVDRDEIGMTYDLYHSAVMDERTEDVARGRIRRIVHVHLADHPGRHEPGSGHIDLRHRLDWLRAAGYDGAVGLEYRPQGPTAETIAAARALIA